jgi:hypothetical protein
VRAIAVLCALLVAAGISAQSLVGTWVSTEPILVNLKFSLTFSEEDYLIDCTLGQTIGNWYQTSDRIHFTPTKVGINAGDVGKSDVWDYRFIDNDTFALSSGALSLRLFRRR